MSALLVGYGLGFMVALQVGPISLFAIRSTLRAGMAVGLAIGVAVAIVDTLYAAAGAAGLLSIDPLRVAFGSVGAAVLAALGARTLWSAFRVRSGGEAVEEVATARRAFVTALAATASNPLTIASWAAVFAATSTAVASAGGAGAAATGPPLPLLVTGVCLGSLTWMCLLTTGVALARRALGPRTLRAVDALSGAGLVGFGGLLAWRTVRS